jgi:S1-C subfamily serine protease
VNGGGAAAKDPTIAPVVPDQSRPVPPSIHRDLQPQKPMGALVPAPSRTTFAKPVQVEAVLRNDSLLKVNVTYQGYKPHIPWQKDSPGGRRGLGVVMKGNQVLVTAQMVADATYIELEQAESGQKLPAKVFAVDYEANVALLDANVNTDRIKEFFSALKPMTLDGKSRAGDNLNVWQIGRVGDLIVTQLKLGKVLVAPYVVDGSRFLVYEGQGIVRTEGNSFTLPVVKGGKLAGLLLNYDSKNQVTTVLPAPIIEHFLKDVADGKNEGFPTLGVEFQSTLDDQFRDYLGLKASQGGMFVTNVSKGGTADAIGLKKGDILLSINDFKIDSRGDYEDPDFGRLSMSHIVRGRSFVGEEVTMTVQRDGKETKLTGKLTRKPVAANLVTPYLFDRQANYLVSGGIVFQELTRPYLTAYGDRGGAPLARLQWIADHPTDYEDQGKRRIVFVSAVLPTPGTQGYERIAWNILTKVNGKPINDLLDLEAAFKAPKDGIHTIEFESGPHKIFLDAIQAERDNLALLGGRYRIGEIKHIE